MVAEPAGSQARRPPALRAGLQVIWQTERARFIALMLVAVVRGAVPTAAMVLTGIAVAGRHRLGALVAIGVLYTLDQIIESLTFPIEEAWGMRLLGAVEQRTMRALTAPPLLDHLLDSDVQRLADIAARQEWPHIGPFATCSLRATTWLVAALGQAALVAQFSPLLALTMTAGWLLVGHWVRRQELHALVDSWDRIRRPHYYRRLALEHRSAGEVRVFALGPWLRDRFDTGWTDAMAATWKSRAGTGRRLVPLLAVLVAGNLAGLGLIADAALRGHLSAGRVAVVVGALLGLTQLALPQDWTEPVLRGATRLPALFQLEAIARAESARAQPERPASVAGRPREAVRFENVSFAYPGRSGPVLDHLDLTIPAGRSLAIVGLNGAGKTTLAKLLCRLHDPTDGRITVDGIDLRASDPLEWHGRVAAIFQDFLRYPLSAEDNVTLARPGADATADLAEVAEASGATGVVAGLARGWDTTLSRRYTSGTDLSAGQWQRIALARAVYRIRSGAGVLILDEPTANLDARGEAELFTRFLEVTQGATTIVISHRFSTVRRADRIVVLAAGRVVEAGTHEELMALRGEYATLFDLQAQRYQSEGLRR